MEIIHPDDSVSDHSRRAFPVIKGWILYKSAGFWVTKPVDPGL